MLLLIFLYSVVVFVLSLFVSIEAMQKNSKRAKLITFFLTYISFIILSLYYICFSSPQNPKTLFPGFKLD